MKFVKGCIMQHIHKHLSIMNGFHYSYYSKHFLYTLYRAVLTITKSCPNSQILKQFTLNKNQCIHGII